MDTSPKTNFEKLCVDFYAIEPRRIFLDIPVNQVDWRERVKAIAGRKWHKESKLWSIPYCKDTVRHFHSLFKGVVQYNFKINKNIPDHYEIPRKKTATNKTATLLPKYSVEYTHFEQILTIRRYSPSTIKSYQAHFRAFLFYYNQIEPKNISQQQIIDYLLHHTTVHFRSQRSERYAVKSPTAVRSKQII